MKFFWFSFATLLQTRNFFGSRLQRRCKHEIFPALVFSVDGCTDTPMGWWSSTSAWWNHTGGTAGRVEPAMPIFYHHPVQHSKKLFTFAG
jgi:hypothetical protein